MLGVKEKKIVALAALAITLTSLIIAVATGFLTGIYSVAAGRGSLSGIESIIVSAAGIAFVTVFFLLKNKKTLACSLILGGIFLIHIIFCVVMTKAHSYSDSVWLNATFLTMILTGALLIVSDNFAVKYRAAEEQEKANAAENKEDAE